MIEEFFCSLLYLVRWLLSASKLGGFRTSIMSYSENLFLGFFVTARWAFCYFCYIIRGQDYNIFITDTQRCTKFNHSSLMLNYTCQNNFLIPPANILLWRRWRIVFFLFLSHWASTVLLATLQMDNRGGTVLVSVVLIVVHHSRAIILSGSVPVVLKLNAEKQWVSRGVFKASIRFHLSLSNIIS